MMTLPHGLPHGERRYDGPAGLDFNPAELRRIRQALLASNEPEDILIRARISRFLQLHIPEDK